MHFKMYFIIGSEFGEEIFNSSGEHLEVTFTGVFIYLINKWFLFASFMSDPVLNSGLGKTNMVFAFLELFSLMGGPKINNHANAYVI